MSRLRARAAMKPHRLSIALQGFLSELVKGATVLDVGCVDHSADVEGSDRWLHKHLAASAGSVTGLDILESEAEKLRQRGYNIVCGDALRVQLGRKFEFIIAGEVIEHIGNPETFLRNMASHLADEGTLVITTPHAFFLLHWLEALFAVPEERWNSQHVAWYCPFTLGNLVERAGLRVERTYYFTRSRKLLKLMRTLRIPCYGWLASSIMVMARKAPAR